MPYSVAKTRAAYNKIARHFASTRNSARELEKFRAFIQDGQCILDWGCGNGRLLHILNQHRNIHYFGTDQSRELIRLAKQTHAEAVKKDIATFICTERKAKRFPRGYFDLAFMVASFHHLPDEKSRLKVLKKIFKELKPGGQLIITVWNLESNWAREKFNQDWRLIAKNDYIIPWKNQSGKIIADRYYHHFPKPELKKLLATAGFTVEELYYAKGNHHAPKKEARNLVAIATK